MFRIFAIIIFPTYTSEYTSSASSCHRCKEVEKSCKKRRPRGRISRCVFILLYISYIVYDLPFTLHARTPLTGIDFSHCCKGWALKLKRKEKEKTIQTRFILVKTVNTTGNCLGGSRLKLKHNFALCCLVLKFVGSLVRWLVQSLAWWLNCCLYLVANFVLVRSWLYINQQSVKGEILGTPHCKIRPPFFYCFFCLLLL